MSARGCPRVAMDSRYNPITVMILGAGLAIMAYVTSLTLVDTTFEATVALLMTAFGLLTLASGVVLAYWQFLRD